MMRRRWPAEGPGLVVFDWDGTLIDSIGAIVDCTYAMIDELRLPRLDEQRVLSFIGSGLAEAVRALAPGADEALLERVVETYRRLWFGEYHHRSTLIEGVPAVLDELAGRGTLLAVATAKSRQGLVADLERTGLEGRFDTSRTADEVAPKPSPLMLLEILDELGVRRDDALMVGDSVHDIRMAHNAGVAALAVASGAQTREALEAVAPLGCLGSVVELTAWLAGSP